MWKRNLIVLTVRGVLIMLSLFFLAIFFVDRTLPKLDIRFSAEIRYWSLMFIIWLGSWIAAQPIVLELKRRKHMEEKEKSNSPY